MFPKSGELSLAGFFPACPRGMMFVGSRDDPTEALHPSVTDRSPPSFSIFLETPGLGKCNSDLMYTKRLLKKIKERLCFRQQELKPSAVFITSPLLSLSPLNLLSLDSRNERGAPFKCRFPVLAKSNK